MMKVTVGMVEPMGWDTNPTGRNTNPTEPTAENKRHEDGRHFGSKNGMSRGLKRKLSTGADDEGYG
eukprot:1286335-Karenia_brevis.AAC.1